MNKWSRLYNFLKKTYCLIYSNILIGNILPAAGDFIDMFLKHWYHEKNLDLDFQKYILTDLILLSRYLFFIV
ncbi:Uncharacterized protein dnl_24480 [Desulfonema limicola]|uniref:Uncharacterized protein n=1 Tax=Desulfonema limicola TaxID=45656 RepID=A0A975GGC2_9BACT|nr:Uncharacterized protein dnl_24480 [Desulfonema limicola]